MSDARSDSAHASSESLPWPKPQEYLLDLKVSHQSLAFSGEVTIQLAEPVPALRLNAVGLAVDVVDPTQRVEPHVEAEEVWIRAPTARERWTLRFRGAAAEKGLLGLYRSRYGDGYILTTQCAATATRCLYPCVDRPGHKAVLRLRLTTEPGLEVIFNTPLRRTADTPDGVVHEFEPTPAMATYLTYLAIGRFDWYHGPPGRTVIAVAAPPGRGPSGRYAAERAAEILPALEAYFGIPFPLPKLDLIAVPEFAYGAMENWGAITFREMRLLVDPATSALQRRATLTTIAHEIAHQWFGNLVTMGWWTDIWLNESFATHMEEKVLQSLYPEERPLDDQLLDWTGPAMIGDSLPSTHPVSVPVERPEEIGQIFDEISYGKGAAVLRMVEGLLGADGFRRGVQGYLKAHAYGNATSEDLWRALEQATGQPLRPLLAAWITRPGLPVLRARLDGATIRLTQERFVLDGRHRAEAWPIPLALPGSEGRVLEGPGPHALSDPGGPPRLNADARGFYRVHYDAALAERVRAGFPRLPATERWAVLQDLAAFLVSGDVEPSLYLRFLDATREESDPLVVHEVANQLASSSPGRSLFVLGALLGDRPAFRAHAAPVLAAQLDRLGLTPRPKESTLAPVVRGVVAGSAVAYDPTFAAELAARFDDYGSLAPDLRWPVAYAFAGRGGEAEFDRLVAAIGRAPDEGDANRLERALARFPHPHLVERALELATGPLVNRAHLTGIVREAALNPAGRAVTWEWIRTSLPSLQERYRGTSVIGQILEYAVPFAALGRGAEAEAWLAAHPFDEGERGARKGLTLLALYERLGRAVA
jgi:tricorn protease interacting factor F2/3